VSAGDRGLVDELVGAAARAGADWAELEAEIQAELIRAWLAGYARAVEEVRGLTSLSSEPAAGDPLRGGRSFLRRLLRAFGLEWA
jgi:acyl-CoA reductase-like NAD-dependent aldehyde dehydrogenase